MVSSDHGVTTVSAESQTTHVARVVHEVHEVHETQGLEFNLVLLVMGVLLAGAAARRWVSRVHLPYTVLMLLLGILTGLSSGWLGQLGWAFFSETVLVSPHVIIFVFLPALVFESAFNLDAYKFNKFLGSITLLAGPVLLVCTFLTAALMMGLTAGSWHWSC